MAILDTTLKKLSLLAISCISCVFSDTLSNPILLEHPGSFGSLAFPCYNFIDNQYLITWNEFNGTDNFIFTAIYDPQGNNISPAQTPFLTTFNPASDITSCYNIKSNSYLICWNEYANQLKIAFLNSKAQRISGPLTIPNASPRGKINCCYNLQEDQYFLTWTNERSGEYDPYYAIINADGSVFKEPTLAIVDLSKSSNDSFINCCYNPITQQYFIAWSGVTLQSDVDNTYYCIIASSGDILQQATTVSGSYDSYKATGVCYDSLNNSFFLTWFDKSENTFFATIDSELKIIKSSTLIPDLKSDIIGNIYCTFNPINNSILISSLKNNQRMQFCAVSPSGSIVIPITILSNPNNKESAGIMYSAFGSKNDSFLMTRLADDAVYLQLFYQNPISSSSFSHTKTFFPLFNPSKPGKPLF